jgi:23S rRNA (adenine2503-C2)-methyltransferase
MSRFARILNDAGYTAPVRTPRGRGIMAACGQLRSASERGRSSRPKPGLAAGAADDHRPTTP